MMKVNAIVTALMMQMLTASAFSQKTDVCQIKRSVNNHQQYVGEVHYYVDGNTLYFDKPFHWCQIIYSNKKTGKMCIDGNAESPIIKNKTGKWWYVSIHHSNTHRTDAYISAIVLRDCIIAGDKKIHRCADAYLYNVTKEIGRDKTKTLPSNIKRLLSKVK